MSERILYISYDDGGEIDEPYLAVMYRNGTTFKSLKSFSGKKAKYLYTVLTQKEGEEE